MITKFTLIERLRNGRRGFKMEERVEAADALEAQARRIAELEAQLLAGNDWLNARHAVLQELAEANARIAELEAALKPFADLAEIFPHSHPFHEVIVELGDLRAARAAYLGDKNG